MAEQKERLILLFDGTWNDPQDRTNVYRLSRCLEDFDGKLRQRFFYDPGVGTTPLTRLAGGAFGSGLSRNLLEGYDWLVRRYLQGSEIFVFGFSRGAYTARSLVGMLRKCGLLHTSTPALLKQAEALYRNKAVAPDDSLACGFRQKYSRDVEVALVGVWDTVGALGVPGTLVSERGLYAWHDTQLSKIVRRAYHAMALDEFRAAYDVAPWTGQHKPGQLEVEQRWFIGAHANVGGGYEQDALCELPLAWMLRKAADAGLRLKLPPLAEDAWMGRPAASYEDFMGGAYAAWRRAWRGGDGRHYRLFDRDDRGNRALGVTVDPSVWRRWREDAGYRPRTLTDAGVQPPHDA